jgi:hypothetical protein
VAVAEQSWLFKQFQQFPAKAKSFLSKPNHGACLWGTGVFGFQTLQAFYRPPFFWQHCADASQPVVNPCPPASQPQAAATVRHLMLPAHWTQRVSLVTDLVACYGLGGRSIVFTETKNDANELAGSLSEVVGARWVPFAVSKLFRSITRSWLPSEVSSQQSATCSMLAARS